MATTVLIAEHVLSGIQFAIVLAVFCVGVFGLPVTPIHVDQNWAIPVTVLGLAILYPLGVLLDEFADLLLSGAEQRIREGVFASHNVPQQTHLMVLMLKLDSAFVVSYFGYVRMRIRIARSSALNMFLMTLAVASMIYFRSDEIPETIRYKLCFGGIAFSLLFCLISLLTWRTQVCTFANRIALIANTSDASECGRWTLLTKAARLASELHSHQVRKGTETPYIGHLYGVTNLVIEHGGTDVAAAAAMLHDAAEDQGGEAVLNRIREEIASSVADLVRQCSDTLVSPKPAWRGRKELAIASVATASDEACLIKAADVLHNVRSCQHDFHRLGNAMWDRFTAGREGLLWYFHEMANVLRPRVPADLAGQLDAALEALDQSITH